MFAARRELFPGALVVANPLPADEQLDPALHDEVIVALTERADGAATRTTGGAPR